MLTRHSGDQGIRAFLPASLSACRHEPVDSTGNYPDVVEARAVSYLYASAIGMHKLRRAIGISARI
jgi:hypothetical protein